MSQQKCIKCAQLRPIADFEHEFNPTRTLRMCIRCPVLFTFLYAYIYRLIFSRKLPALTRKMAFGGVSTATERSTDGARRHAIVMVLELQMYA